MSITISEIKTLITKNQTIDWTISILYRILHVPRYDWFFKYRLIFTM